jgi:predicted ATPase/DNA-binding SARP family transcriptional activator
VHANKKCKTVVTGNVALSVFGKFEVCIGENSIRTIAAPKTQALLIYLAMERDRPWPRDRLAALFWPDAAEVAARNNLRQSLFLLRRALGAAADELLAVSPRTVQWNPAAGARVDAAEFDRLLQAAGGRDDDASLQLVEQAVALYRAPLLDGMPNCGSDLFDEWLSMQRERLAQRVSAALAKLSDAYLAKREFRQAERFARRLLELDPLCEPAHRSVMRSMAGLGDPAAALRQFKQCVALLQAELDVAPMPETVALANEIRASVPSQHAADLAGAMWAPLGEHGEDLRRPPPSKRHAFSLTETHPTPLMTFIGRRRELARVVALLRDPACRLLTLCGPGGVGKTRLALQAAAQVEAAFADGALFVSMVEVRYPEEVVPTIARAVAASPLMSGAPAELVTAFLRPRQLLLVIDNFEQVVEGAPQLVALLQAAPQIKILVTSREVLRLYGERTFRVPPLTLAKREVDAPETVAASDAVQLFVSHARAAAPEFEAKAETLDAIAELCARLDGLPLAIELAAARVRMLSPQKMLDQLRRGKSATRLLDRGASDVPPRQRTLFAAIDWSYQLLTDEERTLFRRLAVFAGGASLDEIHAACTDDGKLLSSDLRNDGAAMDRLMGLIESLMDKSLILCEESGGTDAELRVELLVTMREYGYQKLEEEGEAADIQRRHALAYLHFAQANHPYPATQSALPVEAQLRRVRLLHREFANYQAALRWSGDEVGRRDARFLVHGQQR